MAADFIWDTEKEAKNIIKHGISFKTASLVFNDLNRFEIYDEKHSNGFEDRYITIGMVGDVITVVYTMRFESIRIISARPAAKKERELYYGDYAL